MFYWNYILLLTGGGHLAFTSNPQPRFLGLMLVLTATLGMGLREYGDLWVIPGTWYIGSTVYIALNVVVIALSPAQLLLLLLWKDEKPKTGIVIHHPKPGDSIDKTHVDIVAVHSLGSNPDWAWKHEASGMMWLKDLLPEAFPEARIMAFNHNSRWDIDAAVKSVQNCGKELLDTLGPEREGTLQKRPIIFIGHSFGGIIIKKALVTAGEKNNDLRYKDFENSVAGIVFLGVPHYGSRLTALGRLMSYGTYWLGSSTELLESLEPGAQPLRELNDRFLGGYQGYKIANFWEKYKTKKWGVPLLLAVDQNSGTIPGRTNIGLDADHVGMNKFVSEKDNNYKLVKYEIEKMVKCVLEEVLKSETVYATKIDDEMRECLKSLAFKEMESRQNDVSKSEELTFDWIWDHEKFVTWLEESSGVFWVLGKPGSGKSTFIKYVFERFAKNRTAGDVPTGSTAVASFFFNNRGEMLEKSSRGFLQSLIHQILSLVPALFNHILPEYKTRKERFGKDFEWPLQKLFEILLCLVADPIAKSIYIFIDAIDECENNSKTQVRTYLMKLAISSCKNRHLKLFVTSRPEPQLLRIITTMERDIAIFHKIILQDFTRSDLRIYVKSRIGRFPKDCKKFLEYELLDRAQGVFLWATLVTDMLEEMVDGASHSELQRKLDSIPVGLNELYTGMLNGLPAEYHDEAKIMFQWAILAVQPLSLEDFRYAIAIGLHKFSSQEDIEKSPSVQKLSETESRVRRFSGGLLEVSSGRVQPIHQSVRDFLLIEEEGVRATTDYTQLRIVKSQGHAQLTTNCISFLCFPEILSQMSSRWMHTEIPFLFYASEYWTYHAHISSESGTLEAKTIREFLWHDSGCEYLDYIYSESSGKKKFLNTPLSFVYEKRMFQFVAEIIADGSYSSIPNFCQDALQVAVYYGHEEVVVILLEKGADVNAQGGKYGNALQTAASRNHQKVVQILVENRANVNAQGGKYGNALQAAAEKGSWGIVRFLIKNGADVNAQGGEYGNTLQVAVYGDHQEIVRLLVENGADVNAQGGKYGNSLQAAAQNGNQEIVWLLVENRDDVNAQGGFYGNAMQAAAATRNQEIVQFLVENGADVNAQGGKYGNALQAAVVHRDQGIMRFLIESGANVNDAQGGYYWNALQAAAATRNQEIMRFLVENGADVNAQGGKYGNALQAAATFKGQEIVQFLVENGADVNAKGGYYGNALQAAALDGNQEIVRFLIENGADINAQGGKYGNALQAAMRTPFRNPEVVQYLIENGANDKMKDTSAASNPRIELLTPVISDLEANH